jgi:tripartite-type tricarboxylate transporter receptor subunit TctC
VVLRLKGALRCALGSKEMTEKFAQQGFDAYLTTPEEAGKFIAAEVQRFAKVIKSRKITAE